MKKTVIMQAKQIKAFFVDGILEGEIKLIPYSRIWRVPVVANIKFESDFDKTPEIEIYYLHKLVIMEKIVYCFSIYSDRIDMVFRGVDKMGRRGLFDDFL